MLLHVQKSTADNTKKSKDIVPKKKDDSDVKVLNVEMMANWNSSHDAVLVNALIEHVANRLRNDSRFTKTAWDKTLEEFNVWFKVNYTY